jgi:hypothetical protein
MEFTPMTRLLPALALLLLPAAVHAAIVQVTVSGTFDRRDQSASTSPSNFSSSEADFISSVSTSAPNNTFTITFAYDSSVNPASTGSTTIGGWFYNTATYTSGITFLSGHVGSFTDLSSFTPSLILYQNNPTFNSAGADRFDLFLDDPATSRLFNLTVDFGFTNQGGRDVLGATNRLPASTIFNGSVSAIFAGAEVRANPKFISYAKSINDGTEAVTAVIPVPEPTSLLLLSLTAPALLFRKRR